MSPRTAPSALLSPTAVGDLNRSRVLQALWDHGPQSRADLARLAGVTRGTIGNIVQSLVDADLLEEGPPRTGHVGKPAVPLWFAERAALTVVAAIDATRIRTAIVNARGELLQQVESDVPAGDADVADLQALVVDHVAAAADGWESELIGVGVAVPGVYDHATRSVLGSGPVPALAGTWLPTAIEDALELPVSIENDSRVQALGEKWFGDGRGLSTFASLQTGHGIGVGMVIDGRVYRGSNSHAAEFGHVCVDPNGPTCICGLVGCWEAIATLRWIRRRARDLGLAGARGINAARLVERADDEPDAAALLGEYADHLALGIANLQQVFAPEAVILHGDAATAGEPFRALIQERTEARVFPHNVSEVDVRISDLGEAAGLVGAAALVLSEQFALTG